MEGVYVERKLDELLSIIRSYNPHVHYKIIQNAMRYSAKIHEGRKRESGDAHFIHCYETAKILAELKLDSHTIAAGILHDALEYGVKPDSIRKEFDDETLELIQSVSKLKLLDRKLSFEEEQARRAENIRKIILATAKDIRVILIKLADRLHNMRTLKHLDTEKRNIIAQETMDIYAPIAHKLGMYTMKGELEDAAFRFLEPKIYQDIKQKVNAKRIQREREVQRIIRFVEKELSDAGIRAELHGRAKHFYSIYKKIVDKNKSFDEIYDLIAIRIITGSVNDCYSALGIVHKLWTPMPDKLKDYIAVPKPNGYQSLHTAVIIGKGKVLEVQIRDVAMHRAAEQGIASHWRYKGDEQDKRFDRQIEWLKQILEWKRTSDAKEFIETLKIDLFEKQMFVFTPRGDSIVLPEEGTVIDFAYAVHTDIGDHCKQAKVNGSIVPLDHVLSPGDIVEITTVKNKTVSRAWLTFVKSIHARIKIKHALNMASEVKVKKKDKEEDVVMSEQSIEINGRTHDVKIPRCCNPRITDDIKALKLKDGKYVIHRSDCKNLQSYDKNKLIEVGRQGNSDEVSCLRVDVSDRVGVLAEILNIIAKDKYNVKSVNTRFAKDGRVIITIDILKDSKSDFVELIKKLRSIESVINAYIDVTSMQ